MNETHPRWNLSRAGLAPLPWFRARQAPAVWVAYFRAFRAVPHSHDPQPA